MNATVPALSIGFMVISLIGSVAIPFALAVFLRKKYKCDILPFFIGCAVMLVFALVLEQIVHGVVLTVFPGLRSRTVLFALYAGLMAGLFEETGRLAAFKTVMKRFSHNDHNALMYGAGHGGFEAAAILGIAMINNLFFAFLMNSGNASLLLNSGAFSAVPGGTEQMAAIENAMTQIAASPSYVFLLGLVERCAAIVLHLSFSVLVWHAVKYRKPVCFLLAIALHTAVDAATVLLGTAGMHPVILEIIIVLMSAGVALPAIGMRAAYNKAHLSDQP